MYMPELPKAVLVIITLVIVFGLDFFAVKLVKGAERQDIKRFVKFLFFVTVIQMLLINIIKVPWARPRMRMIAVTEGAAFQPWWVIGSNMKETLTAIGVAAEEFKSFPSGHTGCAASLIYIALLPTVCTKLKGKENQLFWGAVVFAGIVAFSRIIMGAHFLTDVTVGFAVTCLVAYIGNAIIYRKHGKQ